jgi:mannose-1-phosphate guanylyltransferase
LTDQHPAYQVRAFTEKPNAETANQYLDSGEYLWNSGMFIWHVDTILAEMERQLPKLHQSLVKISKALGSADEEIVLEKEWGALESITVDYGIMEGAQNVAVLPADNLGWVDIGDWSRLFDILSKDDNGNVIHGQSVTLDESLDTLIYQDPDAQERLIAGIGLEGLVVVDTGDVLFLCPKSRASEVKRLIEQLKAANQERYL